MTEPAPQPAPPTEPTPSPEPIDTPAKPAVEPEPAAADGADDEALLAELPPDVANAVRVKRRLTGNRRSLRELIAEVEAARRGTRPREPRASRAPQRRLQWWSRNDD